MTSTNSAMSDAVTTRLGDDQSPLEFAYGHGRLPFFMKLVWLGFLILATWYVVTYLLTSVGTELH